MRKITQLIDLINMLMTDYKTALYDIKYVNMTSLKYSHINYEKDGLLLILLMVIIAHAKYICKYYNIRKKNHRVFHLFHFGVKGIRGDPPCMLRL